MMESNPPASLVFEMASPHPYKAGTTFTSLLLGEDVADETLSPIKVYTAKKRIKLYECE